MDEQNLEKKMKEFVKKHRRALILIGIGAYVGFKIADTYKIMLRSDHDSMISLLRTLRDMGIIEANKDGIKIIAGVAKKTVI